MMNLQRRKTAAIKKATTSPRHGRVGAFTRNVNHKGTSKKTKTFASMFIMFVALFSLIALVYLKPGTKTVHNTHKFGGSSKGYIDGMQHKGKQGHGHGQGRGHADFGTEAAKNSEKHAHKSVRGISDPQNNLIVKFTEEMRTDAKQKVEKIKQEFYLRYGGKEEAEAMLGRGIISASSTQSEDEIAIHHTAERIVRAMQKDGKFVMSFGGYSVTVGRGNFYKQSYPFIMEKVLKPVFDSMNLELIVRNSAIGGIPSFPYGWCLPNFLGNDSDVVSWDYGMNEGNGAGAFESYMRQSIATMPKRPMMILLDNKKSRVDMMKKYNTNGALLDSIAVGKGEVVKKELLDMEEIDRPIGLQRWDEWGAPKGSPGQSNWHPKMMQHELIGWMIAMHFLEAVESALTMKDIDHITIDQASHEKLSLLPKPESSITTGGQEAPSHILYGVPENDSPSSLWQMDPVSCRTSFLPNIRGGLADIIVSGLAEDVGDDLKSRDDSQYSSGWVVDVGKVERATKRKVKKVGGLGYIDMKNALYGIPESGTLSLSLPHEGPMHDHDHDAATDKLANHWFDTIVFCEVNEKRGDEECKPETDMTFIVGGVKSNNVAQITNAASYLKKSICINVGIPDDAKITLKDNAVPELSVDVSVSRESVSRTKGACSISHIVWQSH